MNPPAHKKRRIKILGKLATKAKGRHDASLSLSEVAPTLDVNHFVGGLRFVDKDDRTRYDGGSDLAYDFNTLSEEGLVEPTYLDFSQNEIGERIPRNPGVKVLLAGLEAVAIANKSWWRKAKEQEPATALTLVFTVAIFVLPILGGAATYGWNTFVSPDELEEWHPFNHYPRVDGPWKTEYPNSELLPEIVIVKQTGARITGEIHSEAGALKFVGYVNPARYITYRFKSADPNVTDIGVGLLQLSLDTKSATGYFLHLSDKDKNARPVEVVLTYQK